MARIKLDDLDYLSTGKKARLYDLMYNHGLKNGTLILLPYDHGLEHGPRDFFPNPASADPNYVIKLAIETGLNGVVFQPGIAMKYMHAFAGKIPLILKITGKTDIPPATAPISPQTGSVELAVALGAHAVGYTSYVGSARQEEDILQLFSIREECDRYGIPIILWSYPRGEAVDAKGGRDSIYAVDYAARFANEMGMDLVKLNYPEYDESKAEKYPEPYKTKFKGASHRQMMEQVVKSAGKTLVLVSGGEKMGDEELLKKVEDSMAAGVTGFLIGRNIWQRPYEQAVKIISQMKEIMARY
ncbi:MAG: fructose-bisphosphate aldolase [Candidatus Korarchaeota archaeon]